VALRSSNWSSDRKADRNALGELAKVVPVRAARAPDRIAEVDSAGPASNGASTRRGAVSARASVAARNLCMMPSSCGISACIPPSVQLTTWRMVRRAAPRTYDGSAVPAIGICRMSEEERGPRRHPCRSQPAKPLVVGDLEGGGRSTSDGWSRGGGGKRLAGVCGGVIHVYSTICKSVKRFASHA